MGGGGKTTLAKYVYNSNKHNFERSCFLEDIGKHFKETNGLLGIQKQLLRDILGDREKTISCIPEGTTNISKVLQMKKVLIVLDNVDEPGDLCAFLGTKDGFTQSKIIVTTRFLDIHSWFESISWRCCVYEHILLNDHESLELLSWHAFGSKLPMEEFRDLAVASAQYCGGNPLALKVVGSSLFVGANNPRHINKSIEVCRSRLNSLISLNDLDGHIHRMLKESFDSLPFVSYKELFLHIAVFFVGKDEDYVVKILEHDCSAKAGIMALINRSLLTVSPSKKLMMHRLLQDMGRHMVFQESRDPARRTRVWCSDEAHDVLIKGQGCENSCLCVKRPSWSVK